MTIPLYPTFADATHADQARYTYRTLQALIDEHPECKLPLQLAIEKLVGAACLAPDSPLECLRAAMGDGPLEFADHLKALTREEVIALEQDVAAFDMSAALALSMAFRSALAMNQEAFTQSYEVLRDRLEVAR